MAITEENGNGFYMPVAPAYGMGGGMSGNNGFGNEGWWIILLLLLCGRGWGGFGGGNGNGGYYGDLYPWMNQAQITTEGFQNAQLGNQITAVQSDLGDIQTQLCNGFAGVNATVNSGFSQAEASNNARQIASMQQAFAAQTAMSQGFYDLSSQFSQCCCENRLANCQTQNIIQNEGNATRFADANNTRDILTNATANTQAILDKLCQLELDGKNDRIADLERQLTMANLAASQTAQTARLETSNTATVDALYNRLSQCPVPCMPVYGMQPIFTCNNGGCGCGGNNF